MPPHRSNEIRAMIFSHQLDRQALIEASMAGPDKAECSTCAVPSRAQSCKAGHGLPAPKAAISLVTCVSGRFVGSGPATMSVCSSLAFDRARTRSRIASCAASEIQIAVNSPARQLCQHHRIAAIRLDPVARLHRDQRGCLRCLVD
jgi:hypothetical protein